MGGYSSSKYSIAKGVVVEGDFHEVEKKPELLKIPSAQKKRYYTVDGVRKELKRES